LLGATNRLGVAKANWRFGRRSPMHFSSARR
jgi:hypothetical protein